MRRDPPDPDITAALRGDQNHCATVAASPLRAAGAGARIVVLGLLSAADIHLVRFDHAG
jgi:hypothetical protein